MKKKVCVALADGFEEIEGLTVVDLLRRAGITVVTAAVGTTQEVVGSHQITVLADTIFSEAELTDTDMLVLPGGLAGTKHLKNSEAVCSGLKEMLANGKEIAAICAAPSVLGGLGLLQGKKAACYPGFEEQLTGANVVYDEVAVDTQVITSRGMGTAIPFSLALITRLLDAETAEKIRNDIVYRA